MTVEPLDDDAETLVEDAPVAPARRALAPWIVLAVALVVGSLFLLLAGGDRRTNETADSPLLGRPAPEIEGPTLAGDAFTLSRRRGSWVVLNFFNSTCVPCVQEHPELVEFARAEALRPDGAELVTITWGNDTAATVRQFFADNGGGTWPVVLDDGAAAVHYGVPKVPETWIIDPNGIVRVHYIATVDAVGLAATIDQLRVALGNGELS